MHNQKTCSFRNHTETYGGLCPNAWLINFTNPSGIVTEAIHTHSQVKCIGLCNVPINMERAVMRQLGVDSTRVHCRFTGLNYLSFITAHIDAYKKIRNVEVFAACRTSRERAERPLVSASQVLLNGKKCNIL